MTADSYQQHLAALHDAIEADEAFKVATFVSTQSLSAGMYLALFNKHISYSIHIYYVLGKRISSIRY